MEGLRRNPKRLLPTKITKPHLFTYWKQVFNSKRKPEKHIPAENGFVSVKLASAQRSPSSEIIIQLPNGIRIESVQSKDLELIHETTRWQR